MILLKFISLNKNSWIFYRNQSWSDDRADDEDVGVICGFLVAPVEDFWFETCNGCEEKIENIVRKKFQMTKLQAKL